jgi:alkanesulfonate monooxygenase SsuD/methylene tetrahydromethanopterin reductase-like flavin-dependent oxidoreductase (luciferase family)
VKIGITLPQFSESVEPVLQVARRAEACGLDGVFVFDHLWPMGQKGRPALSAFPLLGAVAAVTRKLVVGTLVARIGLLPEEVLLGEFASLESIAPGRVVAGLGVGDRLSADENLSCGIGVAPVGERLAWLERCARELSARKIPVWLGGGSQAVLGVARRTGATVNLWEADPAALAAVVGKLGEASWGGPLGSSSWEAASKMTEIAQTGATWLVWGWPDSPELVADARDRAGL